MIQREHNEQVAVFQWAAYNEATYPELKYLFAVPNGGQRNVIVASKLKAEGVKRGVPDIWLPVARGGFHGLVIELKADKGRKTPEQEAWLQFLFAQGYFAGCVWGADAAIGIIERYLLSEALR